MAKAKKKKVGRPRKPASDKKGVVTTSLTPAVRRAVEAIGGGSAYKGLQMLAERAAGVRE